MAGRHKLEQALDRAIPEWREINQRPEWLQWLRTSHPYSGFSHQQLLDDAVATGNSHRAITLFRSFLQHEAKQAAGNAQFGPPPSSQRDASGRRVVTRQQITEMHKRRMRGLVSDQDWMRWEAELGAAMREGRVAGGVPVVR